MKDLSINIPTYNRDVFLKKNIGIIIDQLREDNLVDRVEINVSDNASTDATHEIVRELIEKNPDISITYHRNEVNEGPDVNFIKAMHMAKGKYSILFGDDDYFEPHAILAILTCANTHADVDIFLSNRISINANDEEISRGSFLCDDVNDEIFDFSNTNDGRAYFSLVTDHGGILTFISSVVYRTEILNIVGEYNTACNGSCYSFLYYFWNFLANGGKLMYLKKYFVRATTAGVTNNNYGQNMRRLLVDTEGLSCIADVVFVGNRSMYKQGFLGAVRRAISDARVYRAFFVADDNDRNRFEDSAIRCGWQQSEINFIRYVFRIQNGVKIIMKQILPKVLGKTVKI